MGVMEELPAEFCALTGLLMLGLSACCFQNLPAELEALLRYGRSTYRDASR
jgi:hypothetical protein